VLEQTPEGAYKPSEDSFSLYDPPGDSWIKLPHLLKWTTLNGGDLTYMLIIDDDSNFKPPSILQEKIGETSYLLIDDMNLPLNRKLFWKVIAIDRAGNERPCRQSYLSFKIAGNK
jgi:hypothetical protein